MRAPSLDGNRSGALCSNILLDERTPHGTGSDFRPEMHTRPASRCAILIPQTGASVKIFDTERGARYVIRRSCRVVAGGRADLAFCQGGLPIGAICFSLLRGRRNFATRSTTQQV